MNQFIEFFSIKIKRKLYHLKFILSKMLKSNVPCTQIFSLREAYEIKHDQIHLCPHLQKQLNSRGIFVKSFYR